MYVLPLIQDRTVSCISLFTARTRSLLLNYRSHQTKRDQEQGFLTTDMVDIPSMIAGEKFRDSFD